jgi:hypothetical protein
MEQMLETEIVYNQKTTTVFKSLEQIQIAFNWLNRKTKNYSVPPLSQVNPGMAGNPCANGWIAPLRATGMVYFDGTGALVEQADWAGDTPANIMCMPEYVLNNLYHQKPLVPASFDDDWEEHASSASFRSEYFGQVKFVAPEIAEFFTLRNYRADKLQVHYLGKTADPVFSGIMLFAIMSCHLDSRNAGSTSPEFPNSMLFPDTHGFQNGGVQSQNKKNPERKRLYLEDKFRFPKGIEFVSMFDQGFEEIVEHAITSEEKDADKVQEKEEASPEAIKPVKDAKDTNVVVRAAEQ